MDVMEDRTMRRMMKEDSLNDRKKSCCVHGGVVGRKKITNKIKKK